MVNRDRPRNDQDGGITRQGCYIAIINATHVQERKGKSRTWEVEYVFLRKRNPHRISGDEKYNI